MIFYQYLGSMSFKRVNDNKMFCISNAPANSSNSKVTNWIKQFKLENIGLNYYYFLIMYFLA